MTMTLAERLKIAMAGPPRVTGKALAAACGIKAPSVSGWLSGKTKTIEGRNLLAAAKKLRVEPDWLATGRGPMRRDDSPAYSVAEASIPFIDRVQTPLELAHELLAKLSPEQLTETISYMKWQIASKSPPSDGQALSVAA
jgi:transcriptional regulator with XRE-family HTH domain